MRILRDIAGALCSLAVILAAFGFVGNLDYAAQLEQEAEEKIARPARAELLCQCRQIHRGKFLRLAVTHQPDRKFCDATCFYDGGTVTKGYP